MQAARHGRLSTAWRQLFSFGLAPPSVLTQDTLQAKWKLPHPDYQLEGRFLQPSEVNVFLDLAAVQQASRTLKPGTAPDALGWTSEAWKTLALRPELLPVFRELLLQYVTGHCGSYAQDLINVSRLIPLYKDGSGESLRPIAIPTVWRKVVGRSTVTYFKDVLRHAAGHFQYAAMTPDRGAKLAAATRWQAQSRPDHVFVRTDIHNAFNELQRPSVYEALSFASPLLAATQYAWLSRPSIAVLDHYQGNHQLLSTTTGIPQGDPLSSLAFAIALARPLKELQDTHPDARAVAYADDALLDAPEHIIHRVLNDWHGLIGALGLRLNPSKTSVWSPSLQAIPPCLAEACPTATFAKDGLLLCGIPVDVHDELPPEGAFPLGHQTFTQTVLDRLRRKLQIRLRALTALIDALGPSSPALHLAVQILRVNLQTSFVHVFRAVSWETTHAWALHLQQDIHAWLTEHLQCSMAGPAAQLAIAMPLRYAGLGLLNFQYEAALHFLTGALALNDSHSLTLANSETWSAEVSQAIAFVERVSHIDVEQIAGPRPPARQGRALRRHFYDAMAKQLRDMLPQLIPSGQDDESQALHIRAILAWYTASPDTHLPRGPFRLAFATHLGLPVFEPEQRCMYRPLATGRACSAALGQHGNHVHACAYGPRQRRHNSVRDAWATIIKAARWRCESEQIVRTGDDSFHRADLVATAPDGTLWALDVSITAAPGGADTVHAHLERTATAKASRYTTGGVRRLPDGHTLVPSDSQRGLWMAKLGRPFLPPALADNRSLPLSHPWTSANGSPTWHLLPHSILPPSPLRVHLGHWQMHQACGRLL